LSAFDNSPHCSDGRSNEAGPPSTSPAAQACGSKIIGILLCSSAIILLASVVMMANVRVTVLSDYLYPSHRPANAIG
jgi:hypothetical protein